jgi:RimJ/RimL family protein N-acetyltransferase
MREARRRPRPFRLHDADAPAAGAIRQPIVPMRAIDAGIVALEPQVEAHAEEMFAVLSDPAIYRFENQPPPSVAWLRERFRKLESRLSSDGGERWLNWIVRLPPATPIGYVQATVRADGSAAIAFEFASAYWGRGLARAATRAMMRELAECYGVRRFDAVAKQANLRSVHLLERLGFAMAPVATYAENRIEPDEVLMLHGSTKEPG